MSSEGGESPSFEILGSRKSSTESDGGSSVDSFELLVSLKIIYRSFLV